MVVDEAASTQVMIRALQFANERAGRELLGKHEVEAHLVQWRLEYNHRICIQLLRAMETRIK